MLKPATGYKAESQDSQGKGRRTASALVSAPIEPVDLPYGSRGTKSQGAGRNSAGSEATVGRLRAGGALPGVSTMRLLRGQGARAGTTE